MINCPVCTRTVEKLEIHHWVPQSKGGTIQQSMQICGTCHDMLHYVVPLEHIQKYKTSDDIKTIPELNDYLKWISTKQYARNWNVKHVLKKIKFSE